MYEPAEMPLADKDLSLWRALFWTPRKEENGPFLYTSRDCPTRQPSCQIRNFFELLKLVEPKSLEKRVKLNMVIQRYVMFKICLICADERVSGRVCICQRD